MVRFGRVVVEHAQHRGGDVDLDAVGRQHLRQPAPALHIGQDLVDPPFDGHVERPQSRRTQAAVGIEAEALLGAHQGLLQGLVEHRRAVDRDRGVLDRQARLQRGDARIARRTQLQGSPADTGFQPPRAAMSR
jgi:hypothetical protein